MFPWFRTRVLPLLPLFLAGCAEDGASVLHPHGAVAAAQRNWLFEITALMGIVVLPVLVLVPLFAWRYRHGNKKATYRPDWAFSWPLEFMIWGIPVVIVAVMSYIIIADETRFDPYAAIKPGEAPLEVQVIALDWKWLFLYPQQGIATVGTLALPAGRPVSFHLTSDATMQSFFIPALGGQIYAMAGMVTRLHLIADAPATLLGENTQYNGNGFMKEKFTVAVMSPADFASWSARMRNSGRTLDGVALPPGWRSSARPRRQSRSSG